MLFLIPLLSTALIGGLSLGFAWCLPNREFNLPLHSPDQIQANWLVPLLGWISCYCLSSLFISYKSYKDTQIKGKYAFPYFLGVISYLIAFYWVKDTIYNFSGLPEFISLLGYLLYVAISALQFPLSIFIAEKLPKFLRKLSIELALGWIVIEYVFIRIFPWTFAHTQLEWKALALSTAIVGSSGLTFVMLWCTTSLAKLIKVLPNIKSRNEFPKSTLINKALSLTCLVLLTCYGSNSMSYLADKIASANSAKVNIIQGGVELEERNGQKFFIADFKRYLKLTEAVIDKNSLIIWPESAIQSWNFTGVRNIKDSKTLKFLKDRNFLIGGLTYDDETTLYNSAIAVKANGDVLHPYHKQILMPFGEYLPFESFFGMFGDLKERLGGFSAGQSSSVFDFKFQAKNQEVRASPLICYEDVIPEIADSSVSLGATLLVNMSNDAWFGDSIATFQHHRIASFRAIENRRSLVRATSTGLTAVVLPDGTTPATVPRSELATLTFDVPLLNEVTTYTTYKTNTILKMVSFILLFSLALKLLFSSALKAIMTYRK